MHKDGNVPSNRKPAKDFRPLAGVFTILASIIMVTYGIGFSSAYLASANYYNAPLFHPALYMGIWNSCAFPFSLVGGIFLLKRSHKVLSTVGMVLALTSGFVSLLAFASPNYVWINGLWIGLPLFVLPTASLVAVAAGGKAEDVPTQ